MSCRNSICSQTHIDAQAAAAISDALRGISAAAASERGLIVHLNGLGVLYKSEGEQ